MKKIAFVLLSMVVLSHSYAQDRKWQGVLETQIGNAKFLNYPALSVQDNTTESYSAIHESVLLGCRTNDILLGLKVNYQQDVHMADLANKERANLNAYSLVIRDYGTFGSWLEVYYGLDLGLSVLKNDLTVSGEKVKRTRLGFMGEFELGLQHQLSNHTFVGVNGSIIIGSSFDKDLDLPAGATATDHRDFNGYSISIILGAKF